MFCPHLLCVLTNLQVAHIPSRYIPKRYTRNAREATPFDRHDKVYVGPSGDTKASRMLELLPDWCALQQKSVMSSEVRRTKFDVWCCITELLSMLLTLSYINGLMISYIYYWITGRG